MLGYDHGIRDDLAESIQGIFLVLFLGPVRLGLDDENPVLSQPLISECQQALFAAVGQGGVANVKTQMDSAGDLVDILTSGPAGPDKMQLDFIVWDAYGACYL
jgi:hypothetical protein